MTFVTCPKCRATARQDEANTKCLAFRCPKCGLEFAASAAIEQAMNEITDLIAQLVGICPACGSSTVYVGTNQDWYENRPVTEYDVHYCPECQTEFSCHYRQLEAA